MKSPPHPPRATVEWRVQQRQEGCIWTRGEEGRGVGCVHCHKNWINRGEWIVVGMRRLFGRGMFPTCGVEQLGIRRFEWGAVSQSADVVANLNPLYPLYKTGAKRCTNTYLVDADRPRTLSFISLNTVQSNFPQWIYWKMLNIVTEQTNTQKKPNNLLFFVPRASWESSTAPITWTSTNSSL